MSRINEIHIRNLYGIEELEFRPGSLTWIRGANGEGKTSILSAIASVFAGGSDPGTIRVGAKSGSVNLLLDDGTEIHRQQTPGGSKTTITSRDGLTVPAPMDFIRKLGDSWAIDPGLIMSIDASTAAGRRSVAQRILDVLAVEFAPAELAACGIKTERCDLKGFDALVKNQADQRRVLNSQVRDADGTIRKLRSAVSADVVDYRAELEVVAAEISALRYDSEENRSELAREEAKRHAEISDEARRKMADVTRDIEQRIDAERARLDEALIPIREKQAQLAAARDAQARAEGARETIEKMEREVAEKTTRSEQITSALEKLAALRESKLRDLPIEGLSFNDGPLIDGIEWQHVNRARRAAIAMQLSALRAGELPLLVIDDAEHLDAASKEAIIQAAVQAGYQVMAAEVADVPLEVRTL